MEIQLCLPVNCLRYSDMHCLVLWLWFQCWSNSANEDIWWWQTGSNRACCGAARRIASVGAKSSWIWFGLNIALVLSCLHTL